MTTMTQTGADIMREFLKASPFVGHLGMKLVSLEPDTAELSSPSPSRSSRSETPSTAGRSPR